MKKACIYIRTSTERQGDKVSPDEQEKACRQLADEQGYKIVEVYRDIEKYKVGKKMVEPSGTRADRPAFKKMIADGYQGKFEIIIAWKEDRLIRGFSPVASFDDLLSNTKIECKLVKEVFDRRMMGIKASMAKIEIDNIKERVSLGIVSRLNQGKPLNNPNPYGYDKDEDGFYIINPDESKWVKKIFEWYADGNSIPTIRENLITHNAEQTKYKKKYVWHRAIILRILRSAYYWQGFTEVKWDKQIYNIPIPPIIDPVLSKRVLNRKSNFKQYPAGNQKMDSLVAGIIYCAHCGVKMAQRSSTNGYIKKGATEPKRYNNYSCNNWLHRMNYPDNCAKSIRLEYVDQLVWDVTWSFFEPGKENQIDNLVQKRIESLQEKEQTASSEIERLSTELEKLTQERVKVISWCRKNLISDEDLEIQLRAIKLSEDELKQELTQAKLSIGNESEKLIGYAKIYREEISKYYKVIALAKPKTDKQKAFIFRKRKELISVFIKRIEVDKDKKLKIIINVEFPNSLLDKINELPDFPVSIYNPLTG